jgi:ribosome biogenesis GTPase
MLPEELGYNAQFETWRVEQHLEDFETGRVTAEHRERYVVVTTNDEYDAEITGNMRFTAKGREDFPAVGDWVALTPYDPGFAIIHRIFPRYSTLRRQAVGQFGEVQVIAANIDVAFLVQAVDRDLNINRLERYLTLSYASGIRPVIVLTKTDLIDDLKVEKIMDAIRQRIHDVQVLALSNETRAGYNQVESLMEKGKTYCMLGSSGVGKSTLLNNLSGRDKMKTDEISQSTNKGRHITTHRELIVLGNGAILIDNPGMREVGIADPSDGLETTFDAISRYASQCRYPDCTHIHETGCAVLDALQKGEIDKGKYENYLKLAKEKAYFETSAADRKRRDKMFGKIVKDYIKKDYKHKN